MDTLMGIDNFPDINPPLPSAVDIGESRTWLYDLGNTVAVIAGLQKVHGQVTALIGEANLGSGDMLEHGGGEDAAIAALLHDAVEDSADGSAMAEQIQREFGDRIAGIVIGCSDAIAVLDQPKAPWRERKAGYLAHLREEHDPDVLLVSACDKLHNARSIVADLRTLGPALWDRFSQHDPVAQLWYYQSLADAYRGKVPTGLSGELDRVMADMRRLTES